MADPETFDPGGRFRAEVAAQAAEESDDASDDATASDAHIRYRGVAQ